MREHLTEAVVLASRAVNEQDNLVDLYTKDFGRIRARVTSGRKILSKLSPHLDVLNLVSVRLVEKKQFIVADAVTLDRFASLRSSPGKLAAVIILLFVLKNLSSSTDPDLRLWHWLIRSLKGSQINLRDFLKILGYDASAARCEICHSRFVSYFSLVDQSFVCNRCHFKLAGDRLLLIK